MIARLWHGWTTRENADAYEALLRSEVLPGIHRIPGYHGAYLLRRDADLGRDLQILLAGRGQQDNACSFDLPRRQRTTPRPLLESTLLLFGQDNRGCNTHVLVS